MRKWLFTYENEETGTEESFYCMADVPMRAVYFFTEYRINNNIKVVTGSLTFYEMPV